MSAAAAEGSIAGTVKLSGTAPHMKGIDMSKDPYCVKQHENSPAHLENVEVGCGRWNKERRSLHFGRPHRQRRPGTASGTPTFDQKGCMYIPHVLAMDAGPEIQSDNQRPNNSQHPSAAQSNGGKHSMERIAAAGSAAYHEELEGDGNDSRSNATFIRGCTDISR